MSKVFIEKLPAETLRGIFDFLDKYDIIKCMFVCKKWSMIAKPVYYRDVVVNKGYHNIRFLETVSNYNLGEYIQCLTMDRCNTRGRRGLLSSLPFIIFCQQVIQSCPNLLVLNLNASDPLYFLRTLIENVNSLKKLESICIKWNGPGASRSPAVKYYFLSANLIHQNTIRTLDIPNLPEEVWIRSSDFSKRFYLCQFSCLEKLQIDQSRNQFISLPQILATVPTLNSLRYLDHDGNLGIAENDLLKSKDIKYIKLQELYLDINSLSSNDMKYIMNCIPNLKSLDISEVSRWINDTDLFDIRDFEKFCDKVNVFNGLNALPTLFSNMNL